MLCRCAVGMEPGLGVAMLWEIDGKSLFGLWELVERAWFVWRCSAGVGGKDIVSAALLV